MTMMTMTMMGCRSEGRPAHRPPAVFLLQFIRSSHQMELCSFLFWQTLFFLKVPLLLPDTKPGCRGLTLWKDKDLSKCFVFVLVELNRIFLSLQHIWRFRWLISLNEKESKTHSSKKQNKRNHQRPFPAFWVFFMVVLPKESTSSCSIFPKKQKTKSSKRSCVCSRGIMPAAGRRWPAALGRCFADNQNKLLSRQLSTGATQAAPRPEPIQFQAQSLHKQLCGLFLLSFSSQMSL